MKGPISLLRNSIDVFMQNPTLFVGIYIVPGILTFLFTLTADLQSQLGISGPVSSVLLGILWILLIVSSIFMGIAMILAVMNPTLTIKSAYYSAKPFFWRYLALSILVGLAVFAGFILLVIPGIIFIVWFAFSYYVLIEEGADSVGSMKRSKALVSGRWFAVAGRLLALLVIGIVLGVLFGVLEGMTSALLGGIVVALITLLLNAIFTPVSVAYLYLLYKDLKAASGSVAEPAPVAGGQSFNEVM